MAPVTTRSYLHSAYVLVAETDQTQPRMSVTVIIVSCQSGQRSYFGCRLLAQNILRVRNLTAAWRTWSTATQHA
jgi:rhodanese-related sulfurtransferase